MAFLKKVLIGFTLAGLLVGGTVLAQGSKAARPPWAKAQNRRRRPRFIARIPAP